MVNFQWQGAEDNTDYSQILQTAAKWGEIMFKSVVIFFFTL